MSAWRTFRKAHTTTRDLGLGVGERIGQRMQENEILRAAVKNEDWVTRDEIILERMRRREGLMVTIFFFPTFLTWFWGWHAFVAALGLWGWRVYSMRCKIQAIMWDMPSAEADIRAMMRGGVWAALTTVLVMLMAPPYMFFTFTIAGWLVTLGFLSVGLMQLHAYHASLNVEAARAYAQADWDMPRLTGTPQHSLRQQKRKMKRFSKKRLHGLKSVKLTLQWIEWRKWAKSISSMV